MSLILEALKKSEAKRRLGEAPDLGTPFMPRRERHNLLPYLIVVILASGIGGWWLLRPHAPAPTIAPSRTTPAAVTAKPPLHLLPQNRIGFAHPPTSAHPPAASGDNPPTMNAANPNSPRAPTGMRQHEPPRMAPRTPAPSRTAASTPQAIAPARPASALAVHTPTVASAAATPAPVRDAATRLPPNHKATKTATTIGAPPAAFPPGTKAYAELPFSVRKAMPTLKLSMHVYAADPAQRFIILNDSRMVEGDKTADDVTLREIRPDGVVLEFQGQTFFYPRDGF